MEPRKLIWVVPAFYSAVVIGIVLLLSAVDWHHEARGLGRVAGEFKRGMEETQP